MGIIMKCNIKTVEKWHWILNKHKTIQLLIPLIFVAACTEEAPVAEYVERPVEEIYNEALTMLEKREYDEALWCSKR